MLKSFSSMPVISLFYIQAYFEESYFSTGVHLETSPGFIYSLCLPPGSHCCNFYGPLNRGHEPSFNSLGQGVCESGSEKEKEKVWQINVCVCVRECVWRELSKVFAWRRENGMEVNAYVRWCVRGSTCITHTLIPQKRHLSDISLSDYVGTLVA